MKKPLNLHGLNEESKRVYIQDLENNEQLRNELFKCPYCLKKLSVVKNENNPNYTNYFRHEVNAECALQDYSRVEIEEIDWHIKRGESERHK